MKKLITILILALSFNAFAQGDSLVYEEEDFITVGDYFVTYQEPAAPTAPVDSFLINFENGSYAQTGYLSVINNVTTAYTISGSMTITAQGSYGAGASGMTGTIVPDNVSQTYHYGSPRSWEIENISYNYVKVRIFASRGSVSDGRSADYTVESQTVNFTSDGNTDTWINFNSIAVPGDDAITISMVADAGSNGQYINGIHLLFSNSPITD